MWTAPKMAASVYNLNLLSLPSQFRRSNKNADCFHLFIFLSAALNATRIFSQHHYFPFGSSRFTSRFPLKVGLNVI